MSIAQALHSLNAEIMPSGAKLVAVSKTKPVSALQQAYDAGQRLFGENKAQEMAEKADQLPKDIEWHFIGHLQTNKVRLVVPVAALIHSLDSVKLLAEIDKEARKAGKVQNCLLQIYLAKEETKFGLSEEEAIALLQSDTFAAADNVRITGLMGLASNTDDMEQLRSEFRSLKVFAEKLKGQFMHPRIEIKELSCGMSGDYKIAMEEGSTLVRIGSAIFGERDYSI
ncbi:MAG: YggS family pyridoxal phosphate-dependent enzyme [Bacteroidota bacterium]